MNIISKMGKNVASTPKPSSYETEGLKMFSTPNQSKKRYQSSRRGEREGTSESGGSHGGGDGS